MKKRNYDLYKDSSLLGKRIGSNITKPKLRPGMNVKFTGGQYPDMIFTIFGLAYEKERVGGKPRRVRRKNRAKRGRQKYFKLQGVAETQEITSKGKKVIKAKIIKLKRINPSLLLPVLSKGKKNESKSI